MFAHCQDDRQVLDTLHVVACACHPAQGGHQREYAAVCRLAREALRGAWPFDGPEPALFDVFCAARGVANPFGPRGIAAAATATAVATAVAANNATTGAPRPWTPPPPYATLGGAGRCVRVAQGRARGSA